MHDREKAKLITPEQFFENSGRCFEKRKIPFLCADNEFKEYMDGTYRMPKSISANPHINKEIYLDKLKLIWHAVSGLQIEIANLLIYKNQSKIESSSEEHEILNRALCCHHVSIAFECLYRVWEKVTHVLFYLHFKAHQKALYYDQVIDAIKKSGQYDEIIVKKLNEMKKHWFKVANIRNRYSHEEFRIFDYEYKPSKIVDQYGIPLNFTEIQKINIENDCCIIIEKYNKLPLLNRCMRGFIKNFPLGRII